MFLLFVSYFLYLFFYFIFIWRNKVDNSYTWLTIMFLLIYVLDSVSFVMFVFITTRFMVNKVIQ